MTNPGPSRWFVAEDARLNTDLLTEVLRENGHLNGGTRVEEIELTPFETTGIGSEMYTAKLKYSSEGHRLPDRIVIKRPLLGDRGQGGGECLRAYP